MIERRVRPSPRRASRRSPFLSFGTNDSPRRRGLLPRRRVRAPSSRILDSRHLRGLAFETIDVKGSASWCGRRERLPLHQAGDPLGVCGEPAATRVITSSRGGRGLRVLLAVPRARGPARGRPGVAGDLRVRHPDPPGRGPRTSARAPFPSQLGDEERNMRT
jgi:hypothetical protein